MVDFLKNGFKNGTSFFAKKQTNILEAAAIIGLMMMVSRVLGLVRDRFLASYFGASTELDVYFAAFRLPDIIFQLLVMGALSTAFIPVFSSFLSQKKEEEAWHVASSVINASFLGFGILSLFLFIFTWPLSRLITPGLPESQLGLLVFLTRLMLLGQFFLIISNFLTGALQSYRRFFIPALSPVLYNVGIIIGIVGLTPVFGIVGPAVGVIIGAFLHFIIQIPIARALGFKYSFTLDLKHKGVREVGKLTLPRMVGLAVSQIDPTVDIVLASLLGTGAISVFNLALHLQTLPVGVFAFAIGTAALPTLAAEFSQENKENFKKVFVSSFHQILYLTLPASVFLLVLRLPIVRLTLGVGNFDWPATLSTALTLGLFSLSIFAQSEIHILARAFYALHNTKIPVVVGITSMVINVIAAVILIRTPLEVAGLALAASIANFFNAGLLFILLDKKVGHFDRASLFLPALKIGVSSAIMGIVIYAPLKVLDRVFFDTRYVVPLLTLTFLVSFLGIGTYLLLTYLMDLKELELFVGILSKIKQWPQALKKVKTLETEDGKM